VGPTARFPTFIALISCSDFLPPVPPGFVSFASAVPPRARLFAPGDVGPLPQARVLWAMVSPTTSLIAETAGSPRLLVSPNAPMPCSWTPVEPLRQASIQRSGAAFRDFECVGFHDETSFRGSITRPSGSLCTLRGLGYPSTFPPRNTRFRLLASFTERGWLPAGDKREVSI